MIDKLIQLIKKMQGHIVAYGITNKKIVDAIEANKKIINCDLLNSNYDKKSSKGHSKYIKSIRQKYKKNKIDYMIINADEIDEYLSKIVVDSTYITKNKLFLYSDKHDLNDLVKRYSRYNIKIKEHNIKNGSIIEIDVANTKNGWLKDKLYYLIDVIEIVSDKIGDLMN